MNKKHLRNIIFYGFIILIFILFIQFGLRLVIVNGDSMADTLHSGDIIAIWQWDVTPEPGDIIVTNTNNPFGIRLTKRVIAVSGQTVIMKDHALFVDEKIIASSINGADFEIVIPESAIFLLGDNYNFSKDSREIGVVSIDDILGKVVFRIWPIGLCLPLI